MISDFFASGIRSAKDQVVKVTLRSIAYQSKRATHIRMQAVIVFDTTLRDYCAAFSAASKQSVTE